MNSHFIFSIIQNLNQFEINRDFLPRNRFYKNASDEEFHLRASGKSLLAKIVNIERIIVYVKVFINILYC